MTMPLSRFVCIWIVLVCCTKGVLAQYTTVFGKAVYAGDFGKVEQLMKAQIKQHKKATILYNGLGSGNTATFVPNLDTIVAWLSVQEGVVQACWNKCEHKLLLYPGQSTIGCILQTKDTLVEKIFIVQEGTTGIVRLFGWHLKLQATKPILVYQKMSSSRGFIVRQRQLCKN